MNKKAAIIIIGNEILSGRTQDANGYWLAKALFGLGIEVSKIVYISDNMETIITEVNQKKSKNDYVMVCGGIGTTPDDITRQAIAKAFNVECKTHPEAHKLLEEFFGTSATPRRLSMAELPCGSELIYNPVNVCPGFKYANVYVFPGIPNLVEAMFPGIIHHLESGSIYEYEFITAIHESEFADIMEDGIVRHPKVEIGSYPKRKDGKWTATIVLKSRQEDFLTIAKAWILKEFKKREEFLCQKS